MFFFLGEIGWSIKKKNTMKKKIIWIPLHSFILVTTGHLWFSLFCCVFFLLAGFVTAWNGANEIKVFVYPIEICLPLEGSLNAGWVSSTKGDAFVLFCVLFLFCFVFCFFFVLCFVFESTFFFFIRRQITH